MCGLGIVSCERLTPFGGTNSAEYKDHWWQLTSNLTMTSERLTSGSLARLEEDFMGQVV